MLVSARGMGSSGSGTMQGFGNTAFASTSEYATVLTFAFLYYW